MVILGDFNLSTINWQRHESGFLFPTASRSLIDQTSRLLLDAYSTAGLNQMNDVENENNRILDLLFISNELRGSCSVMQAPSPLIKIMQLIYLELPLHNFHEPPESISYDFYKANFNGMNAFLAQVDWDTALRDSDVNLAASTMSNILLYAIDQFVPVRSTPEPVKLAWSNAHLKNLKRVKRAALRQHCKYRTDSTKASYIKANSDYQQLNDHLYNAFQNRLQSRLRNNPKSFWRYVNEQRKESGLPSTMTDFLAEAQTTNNIANLFRTQFSSVFTNEYLDPQYVVIATRNVPSLPAARQPLVITNDSIIAASKKLKSSTGCGPDGIPSVVIKRCAESLVRPLTAVFNLSLTSGVFPVCWKQSYVFPVFKKGCKRTVSNYRGIAALCAVSKLFELIVPLHYISNDQHGFMPKRSTTTNLACFTSFVIRQIEYGHQVDAIYTDLSAAFDKINHQIAVAKFDKLGINNALLSWL
ncbi:uncharacterized protein LOC134209633 [Armigeres subalbatus]|uniref:uncharacterized protein LOC134209633 n=1 Tax=Armigeres subalbatus TaxID=124917 RepID=UPI002ED2A0BE